MPTISFLLQKYLYIFLFFTSISFETLDTLDTDWGTAKTPAEVTASAEESFHALQNRAVPRSKGNQVVMR